ncbi:MAG TPA: hypothetical protein PLO68_02965 [Sedimentisphaerales bacterium]|nr:hypothetical protein [Sedimentisphaerales bacterium]
MRETIVVCAVAMCVTSWLGAEESQVNVRTSGAQAKAAVAADAEGRTVIVWTSYFSSAGRSNEIIARRFDAAGRPFDADEFQVNVLREGNQTEPAVATDGAGAFLVAWHGPGLDAEDVFAHLYDSNGIPLTDELLVNASTQGSQLYPSVAAADSGTFVVVWESRQEDQFGPINAIRGQLFDAGTAPLGDELRIDEGVYDGRYPDVAMDAAGAFVVTWLQDRTANAIMAKQFDATGVPAGEPFQVSEIDFASITRPSVAMCASGDFVVTWDGDPNRAGDDDVHARCFDPNGAPRTGQFTVNTLCDGAQQWPRVAIDDANEFIVVWQHEHEDPNVGTDIWARRFDATGAPVGEQFQLNGYVAGKQQSPDVAIAGNAFVAAWESDDQDGSGYGIFAVTEPRTIADPNATTETPPIE